MNVRLLAVTLLVGLLPAGESDLPKMDFEERERLVERMNGVFDFSQEPRNFPALLILDQEGNRYPSFWCGGNNAGETTIRTTVDALENTIVLSQEGSFSVRLGHAARKSGMHERLPGGAWIADLRERPIIVTIAGIADARITRIREGNLFVDCDIAGVAGKGNRLITVTGTCTGSVAVGEATAPFNGPIELTFMDSVTLFAVRTEFDLPGRELGLEGARGEGIHATLWTASAENVRKPDPVEDAEINIDFGDM